MSRTVLLKIAGVTVAALIGLAGCAGGQPSDSSPAEQPASQAPGATTSPDPEPSAQEQGESGTKPSREDVVAGVAEYFGKNGLPADKAKKFAECLADEMYDKSAAKTLQALADGTPTSMDPADAQLFSTASSTCTSAVK